MLPSEKSEKWVRRLAWAALIFVVLYLLIWMIRFIVPVFGNVMKQRQPPPEARAPATAGRTARVGARHDCAGLKPAGGRLAVRPPDPLAGFWRC